MTSSSKRESVELWLNNAETPTTPDFDLVKLARRLDLHDDLDYLDEQDRRSSSTGSADSISPHSLGLATEAGSSGTEESVHRAAAAEGDSQLPYLAEEEGEAKRLAIPPQLSPQALFTASPTSLASLSTTIPSPLGAPFGWGDDHASGSSSHSTVRSPVRPKARPGRSSLGGIQSHRFSHPYARHHHPSTPPLDPEDSGQAPLAPELALSLDELGVSVVDLATRRLSSSSHKSPTSTPPMSSQPFASTSKSPISPNRPVLGRVNSGRSGTVGRRRSLRNSATAGSNILQAVLPKKRAIAVAPTELLYVAEAGLQQSPQQSPTTPRPGKACPTIPLIVDVRPLPAFLEKHVRGSVNANFPSLLMKRFRKGSTSAFNLESFLTTEASKRTYHRALAAACGRSNSLDGLDIYIVDERIEERAAGALATGISTGDILCSVLERIRDGDFSRGSIYFLRGAFAELKEDPLAGRLLTSEADAYDPTASPRTSSRISSANHSPHSSASTSPPTSRRQGLLALQQSPIVRQPAQQAPPRAAGGLRICTSPTTPTASTSSASPASSSSSASAKRSRLKKLDTALSAHPPRSPAPLNLGPAAHGSGLTVQALAHSQSKSPVAPTFDFGGSHKRDDSAATIRDPGTPMGGANEEVTFTVSTIIPGVLYLGPEPVKEEDVKTLEGLGVTRILNMAVEVPDRPELRLAERFEKCKRLPMRDFVEEGNVQLRIDEACAFLDDAGLHSKPAYVHCRAGKSRSVMIVLAFLIHRFRWPLKRAYAHVSERRPTASPNLGFVAELLRYEERELGVVKASNLGSSVPAPGSSLSRAPSDGPVTTNSRVRESLPPAPTWQRAGEREAEQEVKGSGGTWVFSHREPVGNDFLPSRRASKAGLESRRS